MRRRNGGLLALCVLLLDPASAAALELTADSKIDISETDLDRSPEPHFRVWARNSGGDVVSRRDEDGTFGLTGQWVNHGRPAGTTSVHSRGVAATGHLSGSNVKEYAYFVANNNVYEGYILNDGTITYTNWGNPSGTLTGFIAATTFVAVGSGVRYNVAAVTNLFGGLYYLTRNISAGTGVWATAPGTLTWNTTREIAATTSQSGNTPSFFATHGPAGTLRLGMLRWNGSSWVTIDVGAPSGQQVCRSIGVAQALLATGGNYRLYVFCNHATTDQSAVYLAYTTSEASTSFTWTNRTTPAGMGTANWRIAGTVADLGSGNKRLDFYLLPGGNQNVYRFARTNSTDFLSAAYDLGVPPEVDSRKGGVVAALRAAGNTRVFFVGSIDTQEHLYERRIETTPGDPWKWRNAGSGSFHHLVNTGGQQAEGMVAEWQGTLAGVMINRPGLGATDWPRIKFYWSEDDGQSYVGPTEINRVVNGVTYDYVTDPTVVVTDQRVAYAVQLGLKRPDCDGPSSAAAIYLVSTSDGVNFSTPIEVTSVVNSQIAPLDHPFTGIRHVAGSGDVIHMTWYNNVTDTTEYATYTEGVGLSSVYTLSNTIFGPPRIAVGDTLGEVYVILSVPNVVDPNALTSVQICNVKTDLSACNPAGGYNCCDGGWATLPGFSTVQANHPVGNLWYSGHGTYIDSGLLFMRTWYSYSLAVSPHEPGVVYYCFNTLESDGDGSDADSKEEKDVWCSRGTIDNEFHFWTWQDPVSVRPTQINDDKDQFNPEIQVTVDNDQLTNDGTMIVYWYDRKDSATNYGYHPYATISLDGGLSYQFPIRTYSTESDPDKLPRHCGDDNIRFIGDFSASRPDKLHAHSWYTTVPSGSGSPAGDVRETFRSLGAFLN